MPTPREFCLAAGRGSLICDIETEKCAITCLVFYGIEISPGWIGALIAVILHSLQGKYFETIWDWWKEILENWWEFVRGELGDPTHWGKFFFWLDVLMNLPELASCLYCCVVAGDMCTTNAKNGNCYSSSIKGFHDWAKACPNPTYSHMYDDIGIIVLEPGKPKPPPTSTLPAKPPQYDVWLLDKP
jgi:hypothetical protein